MRTAILLTAESFSSAKGETAAMGKHWQAGLLASPRRDQLPVHPAWWQQIIHRKLLSRERKLKREGRHQQKLSSSSFSLMSTTLFATEGRVIHRNGCPEATKGEGKAA